MEQLLLLWLLWLLLLSPPLPLLLLSPPLPHLAPLPHPILAAVAATAQHAAAERTADTYTPG